MAISTTGLGKRYGSFWALRDCTIEVPQGSVCGLVGSNGAGKTTLIRQLAGLSHPTEGTASVAQRHPSDDAAYLAEVGYLAQEIPLYSRWTVQDHLTFGAKTNRRWDERATRERLDALGIPMKRRAGALSGGMRAQVALALALGKQPSVLILDEPVAALDPLARKDFLGTLAAAVAEADGALTVLMSSHLLADLERVCDHLVLMADSRPVLCEDIDSLVATHSVVSGATVDPAELGDGYRVIEAKQTPRHTSLLVQGSGPIRSDGVTTSEAGLEEIVLAYLGQDRDQRRGRAA